MDFDVGEIKWTKKDPHIGCKKMHSFFLRVRKMKLTCTVNQFPQKLKKPPHTKTMCKVNESDKLPPAASSADGIFLNN